MPDLVCVLTIYMSDTAFLKYWNVLKLHRGISEIGLFTYNLFSFNSNVVMHKNLDCQN